MLRQRRLRRTNETAPYETIATTTTAAATRGETTATTWTSTRSKEEPTYVCFVMIVPSVFPFDHSAPSSGSRINKYIYLRNDFTITYYTYYVRTCFISYFSSTRITVACSDKSYRRLSGLTIFFLNSVG